MSSGRASLEAMDDMIRILTKTQELQDKISQDLRQKYNSVENFDDEKYVELGYQIDDIVRRLSDCSGSLSSAITSLQLCKRFLEDYVNVRMH